MIAFLLKAALGVACAVNMEVPGGGAVRSGNMALPEVPRLELQTAPLTAGGLTGIPTIESIPDATGDSTALGEETIIPSLAPASIPDATGDSRPLSPEADAPAAANRQTEAMPVLQSLSEEVKPGAAFTERQFSQKFDGLGDYRAPLTDAGRVDLSQIDPSDTGKIKNQKQAGKKLEKDQKKLDELQQVLYADQKHKVLIVLQAMDTGGKDGVVKHVMRSLNPQGVQVTSFKKPTEEEKKHHWLSRIANALPGKGMIGIFNRSQYEEILVPSVHPEWYPGMKPEELEARYQTVNDFEKQLAQKGWTVMKFFLYVSKEEQKARLQDRIDNPDKNWKFSDSDLAERKHWPKYMETYEKILARTNTPWAPWYIIPANNKWYRDFLIGRIVKKTLKKLKLKYPPPNPKLKKVKIPD